MEEKDSAELKISNSRKCLKRSELQVYETKKRIKLASAQILDIAIHI